MPAVAESIFRLPQDSETLPHGYAQNDEVGILTVKNQTLFMRTRNSGVVNIDRKFNFKKKFVLRMNDEHQKSPIKCNYKSEQEG